jgi:MFS family permease
MTNPQGDSTEDDYRSTKEPIQQTQSQRYTIYLIFMAVAGLALSSYDFNILVVAIPDSSKDLRLSSSLVGSLIFFVSAAQLVVTLVIGYSLDFVGRRRMWMLCLAAAAGLTGLTYFVESLVMIGTALLVPPLNLAFLFVHEHLAIFVVYFLIYQVTNGTWSGAGYAYQAESFPTCIRGTAIGFVASMFALGILIGAALWTVLMALSTPTVTWLVVAVGAAFGQWLTLFLRRIPPGQELEAIAT